MMITINNYKGKCIYKLYSDNIHIKHIYIGSTTNLQNRIKNHTFRKRHNLIPKLYDNLGDSFSCEIIEILPEDTTKEVMLKKERTYIELYKNMNHSLLNQCIPTRSRYERKCDNREKHNESRRKTYERNKEHYLKKKKEWYHKNKERIKEQKKRKKEINKIETNINNGEE